MNRQTVPTIPTLTVSEIIRRLGFVVTSARLRTLGIEPCARTGNSVHYPASEFDRICTALVAHIEQIRQKHAAKDGAAATVNDLV